MMSRVSYNGVVPFLPYGYPNIRGSIKFLKSSKHQAKLHLRGVGYVDYIFDELSYKNPSLDEEFSNLNDFWFNKIDQPFRGNADDKNLEKDVNKFFELKGKVRNEMERYYPRAVHLDNFSVFRTSIDTQRSFSSYSLPSFIADFFVDIPINQELPNDEETNSVFFNEEDFIHVYIPFSWSSIRKLILVGDDFSLKLNEKFKWDKEEGRHFTSWHIVEKNIPGKLEEIILGGELVR